MKKGTTITVAGREYVSVRMLPPARGQEILAAWERYQGSAPVAPAWPFSRRRAGGARQ